MRDFRSTISRAWRTSSNRTGIETRSIFIAWEHIVAGQIAKDLLKAFKAEPTVVPPWQADDFDSIYVIKIQTVNGKRTATFSLDHEGLNGQSKEFPAPAKN